MLDFNEIYFEMISGVRIDPILQFWNEKTKEDFDKVFAFTKFLNSIGQCLFKFSPVDIQDEAIA